MRRERHCWAGHDEPGDLVVKWQSEVLIEGEAEGTVLRFEAPISFWGGVNPETATVSLAGHPQFGETVSGKILVIPQLIGSSSSSAVILELLHRGIAPTALILSNQDAILPIGVIVAKQMGWMTIPVVVLPHSDIRTNDRVCINFSGLIRRIDE